MGTKELVVAPAELVRVGLEKLPAVVAAAGEKAGRRFIEFFTANIRNRNTRVAYARAVGQFFDWCDDRGVRLADLEPARSLYISSLCGIGARLRRRNSTLPRLECSSTGSSWARCCR
jgi:hypothetical protein